MRRGVGGVRKSIHQSWLAKWLWLWLLCWGFKGVQEENPSEEASSEAVVMRQFRRWKRLWRRWLTLSHKMPWGLPEVVGMVQQVHCSQRRLLRRGLEFHVWTINKSAHTKKVWKVIACTSYVVVLREFRKRFRQKRPALFKSGQWHFQQDNAPVHRLFDQDGHQHPSSPSL